MNMFLVFRDQRDVFDSKQLYSGKSDRDQQTKLEDFVQALNSKNDLHREEQDMMYTVRFVSKKLREAQKNKIAGQTCATVDVDCTEDVAVYLKLAFSCEFCSNVMFFETEDAVKQHVNNISEEIVKELQKSNAYKNVFVRD